VKGEVTALKILLVLCAIAAAVSVSCEADRVTPTDVTPKDQPRDLQTKDDVLRNLELAYIDRNIDEYEKLLDVDFAFVFSEDDYRAGNTPAHWGDASERDANRKILDPNLSGDHRVVSVDLRLDYPKGDWTAEDPNQNHPGETWYVKTVDYDMVIKTADDWEYRAIDHRAEFKIRWDDTVDRWAIVEWSDDPTSGIARAPGESVVAETTWGIIKAHYCDRPYEDLNSKDDVLYNLEFAYNQRDFPQFANLLDAGFVFVFSDEDFMTGEVPFQQWDREHETDATQRLFDPGLPGDTRVLSINLRLDFPVGYWTEIPAHPVYPHESWYTKSVDYDLVTKTADGWEYRALNMRADFSVRWDEASGRWQIVLWRDDVYGLLTLSPGGTAVEEVTWGGIKAQYYVRRKDDG
jgi:hypothetical protein